MPAPAGDGEKEIERNSYAMMEEEEKKKKLGNVSDGGTEERRHNKLSNA